MWMQEGRLKRMSDLISRSKLIEQLLQAKDDEIVKAVIGLVQTQPTAYDVEKVVAAIKKIHCKKCRNILGVAGAEEYCKGQKCEIEELCDIVKAGGIDG